jgi:hypothetical protein
MYSLTRKLVFAEIIKRRIHSSQLDFCHFAQGFDRELKLNILGTRLVGSKSVCVAKEEIYR